MAPLIHGHTRRTATGRVDSPEYRAYAAMKKVARRLGVTLAAFEAKRPELEREGFPKPDGVLGTYCLEAVDKWIDRRAGLLPANGPVSDPALVLEMAGQRAWRK